MAGTPNVFGQVFGNSGTTLGDIEKTIRQVQEELSRYQQQLDTERLKSLATAEEKFDIKEADTLAAYNEQLLKKQKQTKLEGELEILKITSRAEQKKQDQAMATVQIEKALIEAKNRMLEYEEEIEEAKQAGNKQLAALKKEEWKKEQANLKTLRKQQADSKAASRKLENREAGQTYNSRAAWAEVFQKFIEEKDKNPADVARQTTTENLIKVVKGVGKTIQDGLNKINSAIESYGQAQLSVNTRLQGSGKDFASIIDTLSSVAYSPLLSTETLYSNLKTLVEEGIVTNVEQRAFFQTIKSGIADTFDVNSTYLKRLIKLQQSDSTAARLGLESYLTRFLNAFVENTEYLTTTFDTVAEHLLEASALMSSADSTEFEYTVQKWLGSLTGVGFSESTAGNIAEAIGKLGSGDVEFFNSGIGTLITMAASRSGYSIAELINEGLDSSSTNKLLESMVKYLQEISESSSSNVVKNQLASIFGVTVSDLQAVMNLGVDDIKTLTSNSLSYEGMYGELIDELDTLSGRLGIANMLKNASNNLTYQTGMDIGSNPVMYALWAVTDLIQGVTGGINIPYISALGSGIDLNTSLENLMKLGLVGVSTLTQIPNIVKGIGTTVNGSSLLTLIGATADNADITERGSGLTKLSGGKRSSGSSTSETTYVGQYDSDVYEQSTLNSAYDEEQETLNQKVAAEKTTLSYLEDMDFSTGFKSIVDNIKNIYEKMPSSINTAAETYSDGIDGFTFGERTS